MNAMEASTVNMDVHVEPGLFASWTGNGADAITLALRTAIVETIGSCARRLPVNANVLIVDRIEEVEDGHVMCAAVILGNRHYVYIMERHYTIIFNMRDIHGVMMINLMENNVAYVLP